VIAAINAVLAAFGVDPISTIGDLFAGRAMLLTYPELDIYPERGPADYYGVPRSGEGSLAPEWPAGKGPRLFGYLYNYYAGMPALLDAAQAVGAPTLIFCRNAPPEVQARDGKGCVRILSEPMSVSKVMPQCDFVVCHGSHQTTSQALLAGKPLLMVPTQLEQFLITRRVVRYGAGLGIAPDVTSPDFGAALRELAANGRYRARAGDFAARYAAQDPEAALASMVSRCETALPRSAQAPANSSGAESVAKGGA